jgi:hypothetical protein
VDSGSDRRNFIWLEKMVEERLPHSSGGTSTLQEALESGVSSSEPASDRETRSDHKFVGDRRQNIDFSLDLVSRFVSEHLFLARAL